MRLVFFLVRLSFALYSPASSSHGIADELSRFGFWFPTLYASVLFILGVEKGLRVSVGHFALSLLVGLPRIASSLARREFEVLLPLSQLYLSSAVLILDLDRFKQVNDDHGHPA